MDKISQISANVKKYYEHNWQAIANCYQKDSDDLPIDPAWYRREIYLDYLEKYNPKKILDVGCGGGQTVLDGLIHGADVVGLEPISNLVHHGKHLLKASGFSESAIKEGDTSNLNDYEKGIFDSVAMLSVIPHVPIADWESLHSRIADLLKTNGTCVIAYRNELFDMYTLNSFTHEFYLKHFQTKNEFNVDELATISLALESLIPNHDKPGKNFTMSQDKTFGELDRPKSNPLTIADYLLKFNLILEETYFCNFHPIPPLISLDERKLRTIKDSLELRYRTSWQGNFMAAMFVVIAKKL